MEQYGLFPSCYTDAAGRLHDKPGIHGRYAERNIYDPHFLQEIDAGENRRFAYILYSCYSFLLATGISAIFYPGGLNGMAVIKALIQICGMGLCICISILPFVCWCGAAKNRFWVGTVLVFVYGFLGIPLAGHGFQDYYPISAGLSIIQYSGDTGSTTTDFRPEIVGIVLLSTLFLSLLILIIQNKSK